MSLFTSCRETKLIHPKAQEEDGGRRNESPVMRKYHAGFGREGACFLPDLKGVTAHSYLSRRRSAAVGAGRFFRVSQRTGSASCRAIHPGRTDHNGPSTLEGTRQLRATKGSAALLVEATPGPVRESLDQQSSQALSQVVLREPTSDADGGNERREGLQAVD